MHTKIIATIQKIRYLTSPSYHHEIQYTVDGSNKVRKLNLYSSMPDFPKSYRRADEVHHWWKTIAYALKSIGLGDRAKIRYDIYDSRFKFRVEIDYIGDGRFYLYTV